MKGFFREEKKKISRFVYFKNGFFFMVKKKVIVI